MEVENNKNLLFPFFLNSHFASWFYRLCCIQNRFNIITDWVALFWISPKLFSNKINRRRRMVRQNTVSMCVWMHSNGLFIKFFVSSLALRSKNVNWLYAKMRQQSMANKVPWYRLNWTNQKTTHNKFFERNKWVSTFDIHGFHLINKTIPRSAIVSALTGPFVGSLIRVSQTKRKKSNKNESLLRNLRLVSVSASLQLQCETNSINHFVCVCVSSVLSFGHQNRTKHDVAVRNRKKQEYTYHTHKTHEKSKGSNSI